ncbi:MAG: hypothetical protein PHE36_02500 [Novosphingobium sp.]|nr:hypothetical protein [Novosphingobium sp.]
MTQPEPAPGAMTRARKPRRKQPPQTKISPEQKREEGEPDRINKHWRTYFLQALAATSNVTASAAAAGIAPSRAYKTRREHHDFAAQWRAALFEGYEHLEMEVLACLRGHAPDRKLDVANAIRLLAAHRQTAEQERARIADEDEDAVLASLHAKLDAMRRRERDVELLLADDGIHRPAGHETRHD